MPNPDAIERLRAALRPLAAIADAWTANELDEDRPEWRANGVGGSPPFAEVELFSGRGGRRLLTLADAFAARSALAPRPPDQGATADGYATSEPRDLARDRDYLSQADAHADEGPLGEAAARSILAIALHWTKDLAAVKPYIEGLGKSFEVLAARAAKLEAVYAALRAAFPHFEDGAPIEPEAIEKIGREYQSMTFASPPKSIDFVDDEGTPGKLTWAEGDSSVGVQSGWSFDGVIVDGDVVDKLREAGKALLDDAQSAMHVMNDGWGVKVRWHYDDFSAALARLEARDERPIRVNETDAVTTALLGIGKAWSAFREDSVLGDSIGWGATREAAEADLRAKEELI